MFGRSWADLLSHLDVGETELPGGLATWFDRDAEEDATHCGYCDTDESSVSTGVWLHSCTPRQYKSLIDRGWRRSGSYCYKPDMAKTCCPQYPIRCSILPKDDNGQWQPFVRLKRQQKRVIADFVKFMGPLTKDRSPVPTSYDKESETNTDLMDKYLSIKKSGSMYYKNHVSPSELPYLSLTQRLRLLFGTRNPGSLSIMSTKSLEGLLQIFFGDVFGDYAFDRSLVVGQEWRREHDDHTPCDNVNNNNNTPSLAELDDTQFWERAKMLKSDCHSSHRRRFLRKLEKLQSLGEVAKARTWMKCHDARKQNSKIPKLLSAHFDGLLRYWIFDNSVESRKSCAMHLEGEKHSFRFVLKKIQHDSAVSDYEDQSWISTCREEYPVFKKYQEHVHKDFKNSEKGFARFLFENPFGSETGPADLPSRTTTDRTHCSPTINSLNQFFVVFPFFSLHPESVQLGLWHLQYWIDDQLMGVSVIDVLPGCVSSVYFFYDPAYAHLNPGTLSSIFEISFTQFLAFYHPATVYSHYYLGYYVHSCPKMSYKAQWTGSQIACPVTHNWVDYLSCAKPRLDAAGGRGDAETHLVRLHDGDDIEGVHRKTKENRFKKQVVMHGSSGRFKLAQDKYDKVKRVCNEWYDLTASDTNLALRVMGM